MFVVDQGWPLTSGRCFCRGFRHGFEGQKIRLVREHYEGAVEKVKIAYLATGDGEGTYTGDADLDAYQDFETPWMANAIADLDRLAGVS